MKLDYLYLTMALRLTNVEWNHLFHIGGMQSIPRGQVTEHTIISYFFIATKVLGNVKKRKCHLACETVCFNDNTLEKDQHSHIDYV